MQSGFAQHVPQTGKFRGRQAVGVEGGRVDLEHQGQVDDGVAGHGEGESRLPVAFPFYSRNGEGGGVQDGREGREPGLVVVLGPIVGEHGVGEVAFQEFRRPALPVVEELLQCLGALVSDMPAEDFESGGRRACTRVQDVKCSLRVWQRTG